MLWSPENQKIGSFDTLTPSCYNPCLLKLAYSLWYDRLVMCLNGDLKLAIFRIFLATLKSENMDFGNLSLYVVNSMYLGLYEDYCTTYG